MSNRRTKSKCKDLLKGDFMCSACGCLLILGVMSPNLYDSSGRPAAPRFCPLCGKEIDK